MNPKYQKLAVVLLVLLALLPVFVGYVRSNEEGKNSVPEDRGKWTVTYRQGERKHDYYRCDTTSDRLYFAYWDDSCVDVYDHAGIFLYSFQFPDRQNGGITIRCEEDLVYVNDKDDVTYVFRYETLLRTMEWEEASAEGKNSSWFYNSEPNVTVDQANIKWLDENGNVVKQIKTPAVISETVPPTEEQKNFFVGVFFLLWFIGLIYCIVRNAKERRKKREA